MHPLEIIREWFENLPIELRRHAATRLVAALPYENEEQALRAVDEGEQMFHEWLSVRAYYLQDLGRIIATRALILFHVIREAESPAYWREFRQGNEDMLRRAEERGSDNIAKKLRQNLENLPETELAWQKACHDWQKLCEVDLSDAAISKWNDEVELAAMRQLDKEIKTPVLILPEGHTRRL